VILLLAAIAVLALLAQRLTVPYPIVLVVGGLIISFIPGLHPVRLDPELVLLIFLPPLLFAQRTDEQAHVLGWSHRREELIASRRLRREALAAERKKLLDLHHLGQITDELLHQLEHELDLEEARLS
jgi:hypothetical protein